MMIQYSKLWPNNPLEYLIPYQNNNKYLRYKKNIFIRSGKPIRETVQNLLFGIPDDEWIYWCMDDKYPIWLDSKNLNRVYSDINNGIIPGYIDGILLCRCKTLRNKNHVDNKNKRENINNIKFLKRISFTEIWLHQFIRAGVLRHVFRHIPDDLPNAKAMDEIVDGVKVPDYYTLLVGEKTYLKLGESSTRGDATLNCYNNMVENGIAIPNTMTVTPRKIFYGTLNPVVETVLQSDTFIAIKSFIVKYFYLNAFYRPIYLKIKNYLKKRSLNSIKNRSI